MKVTLLHVVISSVSIVFSYALDTRGQGVLDRKVSLQLENTSVRDVLAELEAKAGVSFTYRPRLIKNIANVTLSAADERLEDVLSRVFDKYIDYEVVGKQIILTETPVPAKTAFVAAEAFQGVQVSGVVRDDTGAPVPGVNVLEKGTTNGTATDVDGRYSLLVSGDNAVLVFSFIGYTTQEVSVEGRTSIDVSMAPDTQTLQEVVVVGYGEKKKATITGAVTSVKSDEILRAPVTNLSNALVGRLPGTIFINRSGEPGYDGSIIRVRGTNTTGNASALVVIDGIANRTGGLERLNPADIESITILKDGSAAIYGAQAANGVILVTTKRGKTGKPEIGFNYNFGFNTPTRLPEVADAPTYATMLNEIRLYQNVPAAEWAAGWESFQQTGQYTPLNTTNSVLATYRTEDIQKFRDGSSPWTHPNTDWYDAVIKPVSYQDMATLSLSGGSADGVTYYVSLGKLFEDGVYKNSGTKYKQYNFRSNIDARITNWLKVSVDVAGRQENRVFPTRAAGTIFRMLIRGKPTLPAYWPNGMPGPDIENGDNPVVISTPATGFVTDNNYVFNSNLRGQIDIPWVKGLNVVVNAAFDESFRPIKRFRTPWYLYTWDYATYGPDGQPVLNRSQRGLNTPELQEEFGRTSGQTTNAYINYTKNWDQHAFAFMAGTEKQVLKGNQFFGFRNGYISTAVDELFAGARNASTNAGNDLNQLYNRTRLNYFGRINYGFAEKYLLEMVWRYDASYIFPEDSRWGFFPGVSAGWVLSEEAFMQGSTFVDRLKLRASWGQLGNDRMDPNTIRNDEFQFGNNFGFGGGYIFNYNSLATTLDPSLFPVANPDITWEVANNTNVGVEGTVLGGKINFEFDYFNNKRTQMLIARNASIPRTAGFDPPRQNIGELVNRGFDFLINYGSQVGDFNFQIGLNGGYSKNEVVFLDEPPTVLPWQTVTGRPFNTPLMYNAIGVFRDQAQVEATTAKWPGSKPGDIIFEDRNGDGVINTDDRIRLEDNTIPRFQGGLTLDMQWKGFDFNLLFQGATGARSYIRTQSGDFGNFLTDFADGRWTVENPSSTKPRTFNREDEYWISQANTYWFRKTDYLRLKNLQLGYSLPADLLSRVGVKNARIYVNAINLVTIDDFKVFDPETDNQDGTVYPQKRTYNIGVNLSF